MSKFVPTVFHIFIHLYELRIQRNRFLELRRPPIPATRDVHHFVGLEQHLLHRRLRERGLPGPRRGLGATRRRPRPGPGRSCGDRAALRGLVPVCVPVARALGRADAGVVVGPVGLEPTTDGLKVHCSTS